VASLFVSRCKKKRGIPDLFFDTRETTQAPAPFLERRSPQKRKKKRKKEKKRKKNPKKRKREK
jgi:hypothetical protein